MVDDELNTSYVNSDAGKARRLNRLLECFFLVCSAIQDTGCISTEARIAL
jgi:hypothetical protein